MQEKNYIEEDEIDLLELFKTIMKRKFVVIFSTLFITVASAIYAFTKTPMYEVKALVEIASYNKKFLFTTSTIVPEINSFLLLNADKNVSADVIIKGIEKSLFEIKVTDISNDLASSYVMEIMQYIQSKHKIELEEKLNDQKSKYDLIGKQVNEKEKILKSIDMNKMSTTQLIYFMSVQEQLDKKKSQYLSLKTSLLPYNYKNTHIVNSILTDDKPVKSKKKLIVIVGFVTGFILSIFLVFMLEFIGRNDIKETV